jgi:hypothetical protein
MSSLRKWMPLTQILLTSWEQQPCPYELANPMYAYGISSLDEQAILCTCHCLASTTSGRQDLDWVPDDCATVHHERLVDNTILVPWILQYQDVGVGRCWFIVSSRHW